MLYAVTVNPRQYDRLRVRTAGSQFLGSPRRGCFDAAPLYGTWTADRGSLEEILCVSTLGPRYFKVFRDHRDIDPSQSRPTGRHFGGIFSKPTWERFARLASTGLTTLDIGINEPPEARKTPSP